MAFSASGDCLLRNNGAQIGFYDLRTKKCEFKLAGANNVTAFAITPDEKTLALGLANRTIELWDLPSRQLRATLTGHILEVTALAFSPDGKMLASGEKNRDDGVFWVRGGILKIWNGRTERPIGHETPPCLLKFSKDASRATSSSGQSVIVWDTVSGRELSGEKTVAGRNMFQAPDGRTFLRMDFQEGKTAWAVVEADTHKERGTIPNQPGSLPFFCDGNLLAGFDAAKKALQFWDLDTLQIVKSHPAPASPRLVAPDGRTIVFTRFGKDPKGQFVNAVIAMDLETQGETVIPADPKTHGLPQAFAGNSQVIFLSAMGFSIWDVRAAKFKDVSIQGRKLVPSLGFTADGQSLAAVDSSPDGREWQVRVWNLADGRECCDPVPIPQTSPVALALTPDGRLAIATVEDTGVKFWPRVKLR